MEFGHDRVSELDGRERGDESARVLVVSGQTTLITWGSGQQLKVEDLDVHVRHWAELPKTRSPSFSEQPQSET